MAAGAQKTLGFADIIVLAITLLGSASIGVYFRLSGGQQKTTKEFLLGDQNQSMLPVAFSLMASFMSAITLLGVSAEIYMYGTLFYMINIGYAIFTPVAAYLFLPVFFKLQTTSVYEYLNLRFGGKTRTVCSIIYSIQMVLYMGIVVYAPSLALEALTGLSRSVSILLVGVVCIFYCTLGGMKAVIWTDVFQSLLMFAAVFSVIITASLDTGGVQHIWQIAKEGGRIQYFNVDPDPTVRHTYFTLLIGGGFTFLSLYAVNQTQVQRYLTMKDYKTAVRSLWLSISLLMLLSAVTCFSGLAIYSKYYKCDPVMAGRIDERDQLLPLYVLETMGGTPGLSGLFVAGIFSASLSTVSACLNSLAAVTLEDYVKPVYYLWSSGEIPASKSALLSKMLVLIYGMVCVVMAFLSQFLGGVLQASLSIFGMVGGPILGTFSLGMFFPCANEPGALAGLLSGLVVAFLMGFGGPKPPNKALLLTKDGCPSNQTMYSQFSQGSVLNSATTEQPAHYFYLFRVSYLYYIVMSFVVTMLIGLVFSLLTSVFGSSQKRVNPDLFSPPIASYLLRKEVERDLELDINKKTEIDYTFSVHL